LFIENRQRFDLRALRFDLRKDILQHIYNGADDDLMHRYNQYLYRRGQMQTFNDEQTEWQALINGVTPDGQLVVQLTDGSMQRYTHGMVNWQW
jgi:biotin-(acetyl-CoA carboxylase) ligase